MKFDKAYVAFLMFLLVGTFSVPVDAQIKSPFRRAKTTATPETTQLTQQSGPWLIMCASFVGDDAEVQAQRLASELRNQKLKTYVYKHEFNRAKEYQGIGWEVYEVNGEKDYRQKRMKPLTNSNFEEIAVLVGDFPNVEDGRAQKILKQIKTYVPQTLANFDADRGTSQVLRGWREQSKRWSKDPEMKFKGPLRAAFMLPNPLLSDEYFNANKVDHFVLGLNKNIKFSLLKNPAMYSVRVATFRGESTFDLNEISTKTAELNRKKRSGKRVESKLDEAIDKAHKLTVELRKQGVPAYEFHDRYESYVCVGSFDWLSREDQSGGMTHNPEVVKTIKLYKATIQDLPGIPGAVRPRSLRALSKIDRSIVFDVQPIPVRVPRAETTTAARSRLFR